MNLPALLNPVTDRCLAGIRELLFFDAADVVWGKARGLQQNASWVATLSKKKKKEKKTLKISLATGQRNGEECRVFSRAFPGARPTESVGIDFIHNLLSISRQKMSQKPKWSKKWTLFTGTKSARLHWLLSEWSSRYQVDKVLVAVTPCVSPSDPESSSSPRPRQLFVLDVF